MIFQTPLRSFFITNSHRSSVCEERPGLLFNKSHDSAAPGLCVSREMLNWKFDVCVVQAKREAQTPQDTRASSALDVLDLHDRS